MTKLISKLQYKDFERGEFIEEAPRELEEALEIIKSFPWLKQIGPAEDQLNGPSITIQNLQNEYLKVSLNKYYNKRYGLFLLTPDGNVWEYFLDDINDVLLAVADFFEDALDKTVFKLKRRGKQHRYFHTAKFEYKLNAWRVLGLSSFLIIYFILYTVLIFGLFSDKIPQNLFALVVTSFSILELYVAFLLIKVLLAYIRDKNTLLVVSKNSLTFSLIKKGEKTHYNKDDIERIVIHHTGSGRNPNMFLVFELFLKNGSVLRLNNMIISSSTFRLKFSKRTIERGKKYPLHII